MEKKKKQRHFTALNFVKLVSLMASGAGTAMLAAQLTGVRVPMQVFLPVIGAAVLFVMLAAALIKSRAAGGLLLGSIIFLFAWFNKEKLVKGAQIAVAFAAQLAEDYFHHINGIKLLDAPEEIEAVTVLLMAVMLIWAVLISAINLKQSRPFITLLPAILLAAALLSIGEVPSAESMIVSCFGFLGIVSMNISACSSHKAVLQSIVAACLIFAAVTGAVSWAMPSKGYLNEADKAVIRASVREKYEALGNYIEENGLSQTRQSFGISKGRLDRAGNLEYTGETVMRVTMTQYADTPIYLKAYGAGKFKNNRWREMEADEALSEKLLIDVWNIGYDALGKQASWPMTIIPEASIQGNLYIPYGTFLGGRSRLSNEGYATRLDGGQSNPLDYAGIFYEMMNDADSYEFCAAAGSDIKKYDEYVRDNYLSVDGMSEQFQTDYKLPEGTSASLVTDYIRTRFKEDNIFYTLEPGAMPYSGNVIEYFLYDNKKGYCMHFASAAVMIYRLNGIPARYAEGYVVPQGSFKQRISDTHNGGAVFHSEVRDYQAHAWPEIYIDGFGWVPMEVTPAYTQGDIQWDELETNEPQTKEPESEAAGESEASSTEAADDYEKESTDESRAPETSEHKNGKADDNSGSAGTGAADETDGVIPSWIFKGLMGLLLLIVIFSMAAAVTRFRQKRNRALLAAAKDCSGALLWKATRRLLIMAKVTCAKENVPERMLLEIQEKQLLVDETALACMLDKLLKAAYSRDGLSESEYGYTVKLYEKLSEEIYETFSGIQKFKTDVIYCLPHGKQRKEKNHVQKCN